MSKVESTISKKLKKIKQAKFEFSLTKKENNYIFLLKMDQLIEPSMRPRRAGIKIYDPLANYKKIIEKQIKIFLDEKNYKFPEEAEIECYLKLFINPKSTSSKYEKMISLLNEKKPIHKPDIDNCAKTIFDVSNKLVYKDDSQIYKFSGEKVFSTKESTYFKLIIKDITNNEKYRFSDSLLNEIEDKNLRNEIKEYLDKN